jgi:hypothetical protein
MPVIPVTSGSINRRIQVQAGLGKKQNPISNITRVKRVEGMAQAVKLPPSKHKVLLSSIPSITITKKKSNTK